MAIISAQQVKRRMRSARSCRWDPRMPDPGPGDPGRVEWVGCRVATGLARRPARCVGRGACAR
eukprot:1655429-Prymnesium_polylepis.1